MYSSTLEQTAKHRGERRRFARVEVLCRARIVIGTRHYAGYIHDISQHGAKLRTITPIRRLGRVILRLPDLHPVHCQLRWNGAYNAGVEFSKTLSKSEFAEWVQARTFAPGQAGSCQEIAEMEIAS